MTPITKLPPTLALPKKQWNDRHGKQEIPRTRTHFESNKTGIGWQHKWSRMNQYWIKGTTNDNRTTIDKKHNGTTEIRIKKN